MKYQRIKMLLGEDFDYIKNAKILLLGVGGVGGVCLECLYRCGITDITIVDYDVYDESNQNRQLYSSLHVGESKVDALEKHYPRITPLHVKVDETWIDSFNFDAYDLVLDAIDDTKAKLYLAQKTYKKLISAVGSAKRLDPTKVEVATIWKTHGDRFGAKIRYELKKRGFNKNYTVIFSSESAIVKEKGSFMGVTGTFGFVMCSQAIKKLKAKFSI